jgi:hypothetical protein
VARLLLVTRIQVQAGTSLLESYVKTPPAGLCELIWNAFDEDSRRVIVTAETNDLGGVDKVLVSDNGNGMTRERASTAFAAVGDSWKMLPGTLSPGKRPVHGKAGRGRYAAFSIGGWATWTSTADAIGGGREVTVVRVDRRDLQVFDIDTRPAGGSATGTEVAIANITEEAQAALDDQKSLANRVLTEFALHLDRFKDFEIDLFGTRLDPSAVMVSRTDFDLEVSHELGHASLTLVEWNLVDVERRLYLCTANGSIVSEIPPGVQAPGSEFTAYVLWDGFATPQFVFEGDVESPHGQVIEAARRKIREQLALSARINEAETVRQWQAEGVYPYKTEPTTPVEKATKEAFTVFAMAASRTVNESKSRNTKALSLRLLKDAFEKDPESLFPILKEVTNLPAARIEELRDLLSRTTLAQLIQVGRRIGDRLEFLTGLSSILFDRATKKRLLERRQLHRMLAHETWIFGEEWSLTGDDERLTAVLTKFLSKLDLDVELANSRPVLREDGSDAIPDLVFGRRLETKANEFAHLVVELKRPSHILNDEDVSQLRSYASAIVNDDRFDQPNTSWEFLLVGNEARKSVNEMRDQVNAPYGVVQTSRKYKIIVRTWAELMSDAEHRMKFVQDALQYESSRDSGIAHLHEKYGQYLPAEATSENEVSA